MALSGRGCCIQNAFAKDQSNLCHLHTSRQQCWLWPGLYPDSELPKYPGSSCSCRTVLLLLIAFNVGYAASSSPSTVLKNLKLLSVCTGMLSIASLSHILASGQISWHCFLAIDFIPLLIICLYYPVCIFIMNCIWGSSMALEPALRAVEQPSHLCAPVVNKLTDIAVVFSLRYYLLLYPMQQCNYLINSR